MTEGLLGARHFADIVSFKFIAHEAHAGTLILQRRRLRLGKVVSLAPSHLVSKMES